MADEQLVTLNPGTRISNRWNIIKKLGAGAFGAVYLCQDDNGTQAALKTEPTDAPFPLLVMEATVLQNLDGLRAGAGRHFCRCLDIGRDHQVDAASGRTVTFNYVVMSLVGRALDGLIKDCGNRFSPGTAIGLSIQLLSAIQALHSIGYLHRDIKPANMAMGRPETNEQRVLHLIDFGMARKFTRADGTQRRSRAAARFRGTPIYAPISAHIRRDYSRRDDVESWFYVLIKFYKGALPWKMISNVEQIGEVKCRRLDDKPDEVRRRAIADLVGGCPVEFGHMLMHIDGLSQEDMPDYDMLITLLRRVLSTHHFQELPYDWEVARRNHPPARN